MVDAEASLEIQEDHPPDAVSAVRSVAIDILPANADALERYERACTEAIFAPAQSAIWVRNWISHTHPDALIAFMSRGSDIVFALALEVAKSGPFRVARLVGGSHANGNFAPSVLPLSVSPSRQDIARLVQSIRAARPDIDMLLLLRLAPDLDGNPNPLLALPHAPSPNIALATDLRGGFDATLERIAARRKRKRHRYQARKFEAAGGFRRIVAATEAETRRLFDAFLEMKELRFRKAGMANVFADPELRVFFHALFAESLKSAPPPFSLEALEVAGTLRAITGTSRCGKRMICEFGAISDDELASMSPGEFLSFRNIEEAAAQEFDLYDFSVGDEPYKRLWCNIEIRQVDVIMPLSVKGHALATVLRLYGRLKTWAKANPTIWRLAKKLRKRAAGHPAPAND